MNENLGSGRVKGGMVKAHLEWIRQKHGEAGVDQVLRILPNDVVNEVRSVLATTWCSFRSLVLLDRAIADTFKESRDIVRDLGRFSAQSNLTTTYRMFKRADIHDFFTRSAALHNQFQDFGSEDYEPRGANAGRIVHRGYSSFSPTYCASASGFYEEVMKIHGASRASVEHSQCLAQNASECVFDLKWV